MNLYALVFVALSLYFAHVIAMRAKRGGRRYWPWFLLCLPAGPLGELIVFLLLEGANNKKAEREAFGAGERRNGHPS